MSSGGKDAVVLDRECIKARVSGLVEIEATRPDHPVPAAGNAGTEQRQRDCLAARNPTQQSWPACYRHRGQQSPDPMPRREEGRAGGGFECLPFAFEFCRRRRCFTAELDFATHVGALPARHTVSARNLDRSISGGYRKLGRNAILV